jgi:hypothetical protein
MSLLDLFTGGKNEDATKALNKGYAAFDGVNVPDAAQLTLPQLEQYVQAGIMTPAQAQAVLQKNNAYDSLKTDPRAKEAEMTALNQLQDVAANKGMDAQAKAKLAETQSTMNQNLQGQRASVLDQMAARGIPTSLMGTAAQLAFAGQDNEQAHKDALQANSDAEQRALAAMTGAGNLGGQIENQNFGEGATKANSQNAIDQWNAANQTNVNLANQQAQQQANVVNNTTAQNVSNANVANANARTQYNANVPQTVYQDQLQKAGGKAGVSAQQAANATAQGQQNAGLYGSIIGAGATMLGGPVAGAIANKVATPSPAPATNQDPSMLAHGGMIPGQPNVPGDSIRNDKVPAMLSPGEVVVPRSVAHSPNLAAEFVRHLHKAPAPRAVHPDDVKSVLHALGSMRGGF